MTVLALELDGGPRWRPGETIAGEVVVAEGGKSRSLEAFLTYFNRTGDYKEALVTVASGPLHEGPLEAGARFPFRLAIPADAPPPYTARWGALYWEVSARSDQFGPDARAVQRVVVAVEGIAVPPDLPSGADSPLPQPPGPATVIPPVGAPPGDPGWYPDPWFSRRLRYWDGARWTAYTLD